MATSAASKSVKEKQLPAHSLSTKIYIASCINLQQHGSC